jgi:hypothetical protein
VCVYIYIHTMNIDIDIIIDRDINIIDNYMYTIIVVNKYLVSSHCVDWDSSGGVPRRSPTSGAKVEHI